MNAFVRPLAFRQAARELSVFRSHRAVCAIFAFCAVCATVASALLVGCAGYNVGPSGLYADRIETIYVPMVEADTYRAGLGERLTEAVCKKITEQTPYSLGDAKTADATLAIRLTAENQSVSAFDRYDDTRQKNVRLTVVAVLTERARGTILAESDPIPLESEGGATIETQGYLVAEMGQSTATAQQDAIDAAADQIVGLLETPW